METKKTDKDKLVNGIKTMGISLILMFLGPSLFYVAQNNTEKSLYLPILIIAFIFCILAIYFAFKGLKTIMDSMFK
ncbi:DUF6095 family protein [Psychroserpens sp.]|uniref:DUF6095 family protein n=1 Tax=Psychroserpens sp. TaxID=2020870 RepID=UPI00385A7148